MPADRTKNKEKDLLVGSPNGSASPDIPVLKKKDEEEKKGGGLVAGRGAGGGSSGNFLYRWLGIGRSGGALSAAGRAAVGGAGTAAGGLPGLVNFLTSNVGLAMLTAALSGLAVYGLYSFGLSSGEGARSRTSVFPQPEASAAASSAAQSKTEDTSSLNFFSNANKGALGGEEKGADAKDGAAAEAPKPEVKGDKTPVAGAVPKAEAVAGPAKPKMMSAPSFGNSRALGGGNGLAGGAGMAGGLNNKFAPKLPGKMADFSRAKTDQGGPARRSMSAVSPSKAMDQLRFTNSKSVAARGANMAEGSASNASTAFEGGLGQTGNLPLTGIGNGSNSNNPSPSTEGGPIDSPMTLGQTEKAPPVGQSGDKSPWTGALMMGVALLATASTIILIEGIVAQLAKIIIPLEPIAQMLAAMAAALAAAAAAIGVMIMTQHGQMQQGMVLTIGGAITSAAAIAALVSPPEAAPIVLVLGGIAGLTAAMLSMITGLMGHKVH